MRTKTQRRAPVKVIWNFAPKPEPRKLITLKNGQKIAAGVTHCPYAEYGVVAMYTILRVYCYGCKEYFKSYHHYMWRHGQCKKPPRGVK